MKLEYVKLNTFFQEKVQDGALLKYAISMALGIAVARAAEPVGQLSELPRTYYSSHVQAGIEGQIAQFNEEIIVDLDLAAATARMIWLVRAGMNNPMPAIDLTEGTMVGDPLLHLSGANEFVDPKAWAFFQAHHVVLFAMVNRISAVMGLGKQIEQRRD